MSEQQSSYRKIVKGASIFGGVEIFKILIKIIQSKVMAVLLGPAGIGIYTLLQSTSHLIEGMTNFGLKISSVKNLAAVNATGNQVRVAEIIIILRRLVWITGLLGTITVIILSPVLSRITFGNTDYTLAFIWISVTLLFNQLSSGQLVVLQGLRKLNYLANANLTGAAIGLIISIPLYYFFKVDGIVPAIIAISLANMLRSWYFAGKVKMEKVSVSRQLTIKEGKEMLFMGFMLSVSNLIGLGTAYFLRVFISNTGGVEEVGLYGAGFMIINTYVGLVFSAMATDYYPRLSAIASSNEKSQLTINQQAEIAILIIAPIITIFLVYIKWVIILLYSNKFTAINGMILWAALGMYFRVVAWSVGYIFLAKGDSKVFFISELIGLSLRLGLNIIGYKLGGLDGLGISLFISYAIGLLQVFLIARIMYNFHFETVLYKIFLIQFAVGLVCFIIIKSIPAPSSYYIGTIIIILSSLYSFFELNKRINFLKLLERLKNRTGGKVRDL